MSRRFHISVTVILSLIFLALTAVFRQSYARFGEACKDFGLSVAFYFCELFGTDYSFTPTVTEYSGVLQWGIFLPADFNEFAVSAGNFFAMLADKENFAGYWLAVGDVMLVVAKAIAVILPCVMVLLLVVVRLYSTRSRSNKPESP